MTLFLLLNFIREKILPFAEQSKMSENNLCIVFGPCLMRAETASIKDLLYAMKVVSATSVMLREFEAIFGDQNSRNLMRRNSYVEYRKEDLMQRLTRPSSPTKNNNMLPSKGETGMLDKTSDFVKESLREEEKAECYLDAGEAEEAISASSNK
jgi:hypothetical protein